MREFLWWMQHDRGYALATCSSRRWHVQHANRWIRDRFGRRLIYATPEMLNAFLAQFDKAKTRNVYIGTLRCFYGFTIERGYRKTDPSRGLHRHREPRYLPRPLSVEQVQRLRNAALTMGLRYRVIIDLALFAGPRRTEIAMLRWEDVDFERRELRFFGKGAKEGVVPLNDAVAALLRLWRLQTGRTDWVFPSMKGNRIHGETHLNPTTIWRYVKDVAVVAGMPSMTVHQLRHSYATELLEQGVDIRVVQELLRHASLTSTQIYTKVSPRGLREAIDRLSYEPSGNSDGGKPVLIGESPTSGGDSQDPRGSGAEVGGDVRPRDLAASGPGADVLRSPLPDDPDVQPPKRNLTGRGRAAR